MEFLFIALIALAVPFVLPIATWVSTRRTRARLVALEELVDRQREQIHLLESSLREVRQEQRETITPSEPAAVESAISHTPEREPAPHIPAVADSLSVPSASLQEVPVGGPDEMVEPIPAIEEARPLPAGPIPSAFAPATDVEAEPANLEDGLSAAHGWEGARHCVSSERARWPRGSDIAR